MAIIQFFGINLAIANCFDLIPLVIAFVELYNCFHLPFPYGVLL